MPKVPNLRPTKVLIHIINTTDVRLETLKVEEDEVPDKIEEAVGGFFTTAGRFDGGDTLYVNDSGANDLAMADYMFTVPHYPVPLFGNGVVVGTTCNGEEQDAVTDWDWLLWNVKLVREFIPLTGKVVKAVPFAQNGGLSKELDSAYWTGQDANRVRRITDIDEIQSLDDVRLAN
jgi:hypothetical protein